MCYPEIWLPDYNSLFFALFCRTFSTQKRKHPLRHFFFSFPVAFFSLPHTQMLKKIQSNIKCKQTVDTVNHAAKRQMISRQNSQVYFQPSMPGDSAAPVSTRPWKLWSINSEIVFITILLSIQAIFGYICPLLIGS